MITIQLLPSQASDSVEGFAMGIIVQIADGHSSVEGLASGVILQLGPLQAPTVEGFAMGVILQKTYP